MIYYTFHFSKRKENIMNKKYSDKTKEKVIEQYLAGVSVSDLVSKFNVSRTTVYTWTRDHKKKQKHEAVDMKKHKELQHRCERLEKFIKILQEAPFAKAACSSRAFASKKLARLRI